MIENSIEVRDRIIQYYTNESKLSPKELELAQRLELVFMLYLDHRNKRTCIAKYLKLLKEKGINISQSQAYIDLKNAEYVFTPIQKYSKELVRITLIHSAENDLVLLNTQINKYKNQPLIYCKLLEQKDKIERRIAAVSGVHKDDPNLPDFKNLEPHEYRIELPEPMIRLLEKSLKSGVINISEMMDYEDVKEMNFESNENEDQEND